MSAKDAEDTTGFTLEEPPIGEPEVKPKKRPVGTVSGNVWIGYTDGLVGVAVFSSELAALRWATKNRGDVKSVPYGVELHTATQG